MAQVAWEWPRGDGEMAGRIRAFDWAATPLGPIAGWPQSLRTIVDLMLGSPSMMGLVWGEAAIHLYNDGFTALLREHRALALGRSAYETFARSRDVFEADIAAGMAGRSARLVAQRYPVLRQGRLEEAWFDADYTPVRDEAGTVAGVLWTLNETTAQHVAEQALRASETRHRLLVESWTQAVWETDATGLVVTDSPSWRAYTGQTLEEWLGYGWLDAIHPDDRAFAERQWREAVQARGLVNAEFRLRAPGGSWRWTNVRAAPVLDDEGTIERWAGMNIDIDARKRAEAELHENEKRFRTLFDSIDEGLTIVEMIYDRNGTITDMVFRRTNGAYQQQTGIIDAVGRSIFDITPAVEEYWIDTYDKIATTGQSARLESYQQDVDMWFDVHFTRVDNEGRFVAIVFNNTTERKRAEIALREREERQAFTLRLSDALRALESPDDIGALAMRMIAEQLGVDRCWVCRFSREQGLVWLGPEYGPQGSPAVTGEYYLRDFPEAMRQVETASPAISDVRRDPTLTERDRASILGLGMGAYMTTILRRGEQEYVWALCASTSEPRDWTAHERLLLDEVTERVWAAMERARAEAALRASEERFRQFADASAAGLWIRTAGTLEMEFASPAIAAIYGVETKALLGDMTRWAELIVPDDRDIALAHLERARAGEAVVHEFRIQRPSDGALRWIRNADFPLRDNGRIPRIGGIAEDITEAKRAVDRQKVLINELQHRSRNLLGVVTAMANRTVGRGASAESFLVRLKALSRAQALLSQGGADTVGVEALVRAELAAHADNGPDRLVIDGPAVTLTSQQVQNFALALHELATNAVKYGALKDGTGHLSVTWELIGTAGGRHLALNWVETGMDVRPEAVTRRGYGRELIEQALAYALGGRTDYGLGADGVRCRIELPIA